jgi:hypothetical protein
LRGGQFGAPADIVAEGGAGDGEFGTVEEHETVPLRSAATWSKAS